MNLTADKTAVITEMYRILKPGGRLGISDVVAEDHLSEQDSVQRGSYEGCIAAW
nr:hypothetical protein [Cryobacterium arcticum]